MYIPFEDIAPSARIWIYQADRQISREEEELISEMIGAFLDGWTAHGVGLKSSFRVLYKKFLIAALDESSNKASGCSIDALVGLIKSLEEDLQLSFLDRTKVAFLINGEIFQSSTTNLKSLISEGKINAETLVFDNLISNLGQLKSAWRVPAGESWLKRYF